ncbi:FeoC-like transcriptional regulator [Rhodobacter maris]|uniref:FeoC-like transcriptional regulator n=1 Tax=Rhodobacter maris TaxID=446682 RepID=A0A285RI00_9RHOB|nr:FeoC-like transcriptional regulator [Rhodobacter maris]SOB93701.1 FeoC-like transcriptional regulator [Rhodobacter maris]
MALREIEDYVGARGKVSLRDMALHFDRAPEAMREMAARLVRKGRLELHLGAASCTACAAKGGCVNADTYCLPGGMAQDGPSSGGGHPAQAGTHAGEAACGKSQIPSFGAVLRQS